MDEQITKELLEIQQQLTSIREDEESWEHKAKDLERRLEESIKGSQSLSAVHKQLKVEHGKFQKRVEKEGAMESTLRARLREWQEEVYELREKNDELRLKLRELEERELASKKAHPVLKTKLNEALKVITELEK
ncbi:hypothetical protein D6C79_09686 [Aureobasidium pullulans]|nr:hypothetical protein D6C79_09686 [Aureobasidium pullulans]